MLLTVRFTGNGMAEKSGYEELPPSFSGAGSPVPSEDTGSMVAFLTVCGGGVPEPGTPLACGLEKIQPNMQTGILYFISFLCS